MSTQVEFSCKMQDQNEANQVTNVLKTVPDLKILDLNLDRQQVLLEMSLKTPEGLDQIQRRIESQTGCKTVLKGFGDQMAAVAELRISPLVDSSATCCSKQVLGVARLTQLPGAKCFVDAVIDHLSQSQQSIGLNIHSSGNLSAPDLASVGSVHIPMNDKIPVENGRAYFKSVLSKCDLSDCIGRSIAARDPNSSRVLAAGIIARASPVSGNEKKVCVCSGKTIWDERQDALEAEK